VNVTGNLIAVVLLLIANGFFVAAEFALVKAKGIRVIIKPEVTRHCFSANLEFGECTNLFNIWH